LKVKAKKENKFIVKVFLRTLNEIELVEFYSHTTAWGLIQLLNKKDIEQPEQYGLFTANGIRLESDQRLTSHGVKSSVYESLIFHFPMSLSRVIRILRLILLLLLFALTGHNTRISPSVDGRCPHQRRAAAFRRHSRRLGGKGLTLEIASVVIVTSLMWAI